MSIHGASGGVQSQSVGATGNVSALVAAKTVPSGQLGTGFRIRLLGGLLVAGAAGATIKFQSDNGTTQTDLTGGIVLGANGSLPIQPADIGYLETKEGEALTLVCTGAVNGILRYQYIR
jgi:hypothetical protein